MDRDFKGIWIAKEIYLNENLNPTEKLLLAEIDSFSRNGQCFASNDHFAKFLCISKKHVSKLISKLTKMGLVQVQFICKENSKEIEKRIIYPLLINAYTPTHECVDPLLTNEYTPTPKCVDPLLLNAEDKEHIKEQYKEQDKEQKKDKKKEKKQSIKKDELEEEFEILWKLYPRKEGKTDAKKHYIKARKNKTSYETVENGLYRYKEYIDNQGTESQYIPHGSTWFSQERWNDEYIIAPTKNRKMSLMDMYRRDFGGENNESAGNASIFDSNESGISEYLSQPGHY